MIKNITDLKKADNFFLLAGPCVIEGEEMALRIAEHIVKVTDSLGIPYVLRDHTGKPIVHVLILLQASVMKKL